MEAKTLRFIWHAPLLRDLLSTFGRTLGGYLRSASFVVQLQREAERLATEEGNAAVGAKAQWLAQVQISRIVNCLNSLLTL